MSFDIVSSVQAAKKSAITLAASTLEYRNRMLAVMADSLFENKQAILAANELDIEEAKIGNRGSAFIDRLKLNEERIAAMAQGLRQLVQLSDPIGEVTESWTVENGLKISKLRVPIGVIGIIYEARPNVTADAIGLCVKSGNAVVLKGSKDAHCSNKAIFTAFKNALENADLDSSCICFIDDKSREATANMLQMEDAIDVIIPRGSNSLKEFVQANAKMPVIASAGGNCHTYVEKTADLEMAKNIVFNAKVSRPSVCNALEQLLVDRTIAAQFLPDMLKLLADNGVKIYGSEEVKTLYSDAILATEDDYYTERECLEITVYIVADVYEAVDRVNKYGTRHSEAIITSDDETAHIFTSLVDCACCYVNASTRFTDGFEFGFGAEMGISTGKLHARGPLGLKQLTSERYIVIGNGQVRK